MRKNSKADMKKCLLCCFFQNVTKQSLLVNIIALNKKVRRKTYGNFKG